ncbi:MULTISPECIES: Flp family type IVb pilin [unclassified Brevundimonas]|uniref:Flp family type IVb pilin n=1 Tax=unclassified Brevundimonas TaxID=2622653 RepID=UPI0020031BD9|nr:MULTISPECIES: Flp family type IVb pilin [unclassified Brevundimonas]MCK6105689.1 Flp family type IVb pilin [Brevundimonas sp. EYE_349]
MRRLIGRFLRDDSGATAIEYGLICGLIFVALMGSIGLMMNIDDGLLAVTFAKLSAALGG